jgi:hypothetical protein
MIQVPKEIRKLSKGLIKVQNCLYQRALEEIIEVVNDAMLQSKFEYNCRCAKETGEIRRQG